MGEGGGNEGVEGVGGNGGEAKDEEEEEKDVYSDGTLAAEEDADRNGFLELSRRKDMRTIAGKR